MSARPRVHRYDAPNRWSEHRFVSRSLFHSRSGDLAEGGNLWVLLGQAFLIAFTVFGFDAIRLAPQKTMALAIVLTGPMILLAPRGAIARVRVTTPMLLFVSWWLLSGTWALVGWAWQGETTFTLSWLIGVVTVASVLPLEKAMNALLGGFYSMIVYELLICLAKGSARVHPDGIPGWHGTFLHKNDITPFLFVAIITALVFDKNRGRAKGFTAVALGMMVLSQSSTAYATVLVLGAAYAWLRQHVRRVAHVGFGFLVAMVSSLVAVSLLTFVVMPYVVGLFGKDPTLSGRTKIWDGVLDAIGERPWQGWGPGLWLDQGRSPVRDINRPLGFTVFHAHNGALNILLLLGIGGLFFYVWYFGWSLVRAWRVLATDHSLAHWVILNSVMMFVFAFSEVTILGIWTSLIGLGQVYMLRTETTRLPRRASRGPSGHVASAREHTSWRRRAS